MADASKPYVVCAGDYLTSIAHACGVTPDAIWSLPANAALRKIRTNPEMLAPGDLLYLPAPERKWLQVSLGTTNKFVGTVPKADIKVVLLGPDGEPLAGKTVLLTPKVVDPDPVTDGQGLLALSVPVDVHVLTAAIADLGLTFAIRVGHLDPHDVDSGTLSRLRQLGYVGDEGALLRSGQPYVSGIDADSTALARGVAAFQDAKKLDVTGTVDATLCGAIRDGYGS